MASISEVPAELARALSEARVIPFVGAGVSMAVQRHDGTRVMPSWHELLLRAAERLEAEQRNQHLLVRAHLAQDRPNYLDAAKSAKEGLAGLWPHFLAENLDVERAQVRDDSLDLARRIWRLSRHVVTTNYDRVLQWACPKSDDLQRWIINAPGAQAEALKRSSERPILWKLHGCIDEPCSVILAPDGYERLYAETSREGEYQAALETLRILMTTRTILFVGFSLDDEYVLRQFEWLRRTFHGCGGPHYALVHARVVGQTRERVAGLDVQVLSFPDFGAPLLNSLDQLCSYAEKMVAPLLAPGTRMPATDASDDVLAIELEQAHRRCDRLRELGEDTATVQEEIRQLKRKMREGGVLRQGDILAGRYLLLEPIGEGGFATVWRARDIQSSRTVAVKVLHGQFALDRTRRERFFRGARVMSELDDPNIVQIIEPRQEDGGFYFFVMELITGHDVATAVRQKRLARDHIMPIILQVANALQSAHARGVVHRDIKPHNIIVTSQGIPYLTDFDLVWDRETTGGTRTGALGTFVYAAPEAHTNAKNATVQADVYGLAMTLVFMLLGKDLPSEILRSTDRYIETLPCSPSIKEVLFKSLDWEPANRPSDAGRFRMALLDAMKTRSLRAVDDNERDIVYWQALGRDQYQSVVLRPSRGGEPFVWKDLLIATKASVWWRTTHRRMFRVFPLGLWDEPEDVQIEDATIDDDILLDYGSARGIVVGGVYPHACSVEQLVTLNREFHYLGSTGPWLFVGVADHVYGGGAHGDVGWQFLILDLERRRRLTLKEFLSDAEMETISTIGLPLAHAEFGRRAENEKPFEPRDLQCVTIAPRYANATGTFRLRCQFATDIYYAASDGNWDSYTTSAFVDLDFVPSRLEPYVDIPPSILTYWSENGEPTGHYGWSLIGEGRHPQAWLDSLSLRDEFGLGSTDSGGTDSGSMSG